MAELREYIPYGDIEKIAVVLANKTERASQVRERTGCTIAVNGGAFNLNTPSDRSKWDSGLKMDGSFLCNKNTHGFDIVNNRFAWRYGAQSAANWIGYFKCGQGEDGKVYGYHLNAAQERTGLGYDDGGITVVATTRKLTTQAFYSTFFTKCKAWINLDGGGSTQFASPGVTYNSTRWVPWYVCFWLKDNNKGDRDMSYITNLPLNGKIEMTAAFGEVNASLWKNGHKGIDLISCTGGTTIYSPCDGTVAVIAFDSGGWGQYVSIHDNAGYIHLLCHMVSGSVKVKNGQKVTRSTRIGTMGATGNAKGVHLHYQINNSKGTPLDPSFWTHLPNRRGVYLDTDFKVTATGALLVPPSVVTYTGDSTPDAYAKSAVDKAIDAGILRGDDKGDLKLHSSVTRQDLCVMLERAGVIK